MFSSIFYRYDVHHNVQNTLVLLVIRKDPVIENFLHWKKHTDKPYLSFVYNNRVYDHIIRVYNNSEYVICGKDLKLDQTVPKEHNPENKVITVSTRPRNMRLTSDVLTRITESCLMSHVQKNYCLRSLEEYSILLMRHPLHELVHVNRIMYTLTYMLQTGGTLVNEFRRNVAKRDQHLIDCLKRDQNSYVFAFADFLINYIPPAVTGRSSMRNFLLG